jgi:hypothetical protein
MSNPFLSYPLNALQQIKDHLIIQLKVIDGTYVGPIDPKTKIRRKPIPMPWMKDKWTKAIELIDQILMKE